ncbi:MAG: hypothetical protein GEU75_06775 [Dehalococcoidia bacterium]|nr:hypothetical protein [Dehalococcoidia bacterium]
MVGLTRKARALVRLPLVLGALALAFTAVLVAPPMRASADCVFPFTPTAYEDLKDRGLYLDTIELAAFNLLFPGDKYFGLPPIESGPRNSRITQPGKVPPILLKSISWIESSATQTAGEVPFGSIGPALVSFDCGHGVTQVTSGMTVPQGENDRGSPEQALVATHFAYNIARGARILADKWNEAPETRPVAGSDTNSHPGILENWYFAVWGYNGFSGPGANRSNHPMDPIYGNWPRAPYSCGPTDDGKGHNRGNYPYQELVFGCALNPPIVDGKALWESQAISLPDLNDSAWRNALRLDNFVFPYLRMDIQTPQPFHIDETGAPSASNRDRILGDPEMELNKSSVKVGYTKDGSSNVEVVRVSNDGTGVLAWYAVPSASWISVTPYTGVAVGDDLPCERGAPCDRVGKLEISVDVSKVPSGRRSGAVTVHMLGSDEEIEIKVDATQVQRVGVPGVTRN